MNNKINGKSKATLIMLRVLFLFLLSTNLITWPIQMLWVLYLHILKAFGGSMGKNADEVLQTYTVEKWEKIKTVLKFVFCCWTWEHMAQMALDMGIIKIDNEKGGE